MKTSLLTSLALALLLAPGLAAAQTSFTAPSHASMDQITPGMNGSSGMGNDATADQINAKQAAHDQAEDSQAWPTANTPKTATTTTSHANKKAKHTAKHAKKKHKKAATTTAAPTTAPAPVTPAQ